MPRFHFHLTDGVADPDIEGFELSDLAAARLSAVQFMGQWLLDNPADFWIDGERLLTVADDQGLDLFTLRVSGREAPVLQIEATPIQPSEA